MTNFFDKTFTIINQIPSNQGSVTKIAWKKHTMLKCFYRSDRTLTVDGSITIQSGARLVRTKDFEHYLPPTFLDNGYFSLSDTQKDSYFTVNVGDLVITDVINDPAPTTIAEFNALRDKYKDIGFIIDSVSNNMQIGNVGNIAMSKG